MLISGAITDIVSDTANCRRLTMSLNIYFDKNEVPNCMKIIMENDNFFIGHTLLRQDRKTEEILADIDHAKYCSKESFYPENSETPLTTDCLSTGCKTLLNIKEFPDLCFSTGECGNNALEEMLHLDHGCVLCDHLAVVLWLDRFINDDSCNAVIKGKKFCSIKKLLNFVEEANYGSKILW